MAILFTIANVRQLLKSVFSEDDLSPTDEVIDCGSE